MYIIPHLYVVKNFQKFENLNFQMYILGVFKILEFHIFEIVNVFLSVSNRLLSSHFLPSAYILYESFESPL